MNDSTDASENTQVFSIFGRSCHYWQVGGKRADMTRTAFTFLLLLYHFVIMPFCFNNGFSTFQCIMAIVLFSAHWLFLLVRFKNLIVFWKSSSTNRLRITCRNPSLADAGVTLKFSKCFFFMNIIDCSESAIGLCWVEVSCHTIRTI